ncbi:MAG: IS110 family transposase [Anaerolineales bacterium]
MNTIQLFVGLDYHQSGVQVCVMDQSGTVLFNRGVANSWKDIALQVERFGQPMRTAIESCSGAADLADELVNKAGWSVDLAHPGYVSRMKQSPDKTDFSDARMLADLTRVGYLPRVWLAPVEVREMRLLVRYRQQLVNQRRHAKLRIGAILREQRIGVGPAGRWSLPWLMWVKTNDDLSTQGRWVIGRHLLEMARLDGEIRAVEEQLSLMCKEDSLVQRLLGFKGVGYVTAWVMRAEIGRFDRFATGKQLSRFCGLSPRNASSGTRQADAGLIMAANKQLRATLIELAHRVSRYDTRWNEMSCKMKDRGKPASLVAAAVANRWTRHLYNQLIVKPGKAA